MYTYVCVCDGVNGGCSQSHSGIPLALGKDQHALLQVCVCVCVYVQRPLTQRCSDVMTEQHCVSVCVLSVARAYCNAESLTPQFDMSQTIYSA